MCNTQTLAEMLIAMIGRFGKGCLQKEKFFCLLGLIDDRIALERSVVHNMLELITCVGSFICSTKAKIQDAVNLKSLQNDWIFLG